MPKSQNLMPILIAGGGICGLASAIALSKVGRTVHIIEREPSISSEGAGIQIGPNGTRILKELGVDKALGDKIVVPKKIVIGHGWSGSTLAKLPIQSHVKQKFGAPYWVVHRASLQEALLRKVGSMPGVEMSMGCEVTGVEDRGEWVRVHTKGTSIEDGSALIGADGLWSDIRKQLYPRVKPRFSGYSAWRTVVPAKTVPSLFRAANVGLWLSPDAHLVHYPVEGGSQVNVVIILADNRQTETWTTETDGAELMGVFSRWWPPLRVLINSMTEWRRWSLYDLPPLKNWSLGNIVLAGDAAHPMLPFFAQGGVMGLEDARELALAIKRHGDDNKTAWRNFQTRRRARTTRVQVASRRNGKIFHYSGFRGWSRDFVLRTTPPSILLNRHRWLYGFGAR